MEIFAASGSLTVVVGTEVVPAITCRLSLREPLAAALTDECVGRTGISMEFVPEFIRERSFAISACIGHAIESSMVHIISTPLFIGGKFAENRVYSRLEPNIRYKSPKRVVGSIALSSGITLLIFMTMLVLSIDG